MKLCTSCQINSFMKFKHQVYPKCVQSQCDDVNDKKIEVDDNYLCFYCNEWHYSCEKGTFYTKMGARTGYFMLVGDSVSYNEDVYSKFDIVQRGNIFLIKTKAGKCLEVNTMGTLSDVACENSALQEFLWAD